jgi:hypothetical protein
LTTKILVQRTSYEICCHSRTLDSSIIAFTTLISKTGCIYNNKNDETSKCKGREDCCTGGMVAHFARFITLEAAQNQNGRWFYISVFLINFRWEFLLFNCLRLVLKHNQIYFLISIFVLIGLQLCTHLIHCAFRSLSKL